MAERGESVFEFGNDGPSVLVVGVDGSDTSWRAAAYAAGLARRQHARVVFVFVQTPRVIPALMPDMAVVEESNLDDIATELRATISEALSNVAGPAWELVTVHGDPYAELARIADDARADGVVVGASMKAGHRFAGSVAVRLVRAGHWPVTVVP